MKHTRHAAVLLPLHIHEIDVVLDALVAHANECEQRGDPLSHASDADRIAVRLRAHRTLQTISAVETLKALGVGSYEDRRQG